MKKYRRTKNILEVYVPEAEGWYTFATLHEDSMSDADNWLAENARLQERLQSWEEGSEPAVAELVEAEDQAQQEWYEAQASAQERKRERDEAVRQLGDAIWYEEQLRAERDRYKAHMGEAWQEYRRLWLRWFEQQVEYRYAKKREREAKALAEQRGEALEKRGCERRGPWGATCLTVGTEGDPLGPKVRPPIEARMRCRTCAAIAATPEEARERR